ncbi:hypothetical protein HPP92_020767 [Vanilla planifolia]|uniref:Uncharacterized protein n=1 Tax=Vanilla planifolia TaxID=51239 RepID=A0A835PXH2_VANPL|nr:hypothetical protein HPP92_020767 [Vanilla planifolia]
MFPVEAIPTQPLVTVSPSAPESSTACTVVSFNSRVEKFLADSWNNLINMREKPKDLGSNNVAELQPKRRGRPVSDLAWLPPGWERFTKIRSSGQTDTVNSLP